jgi:secreted PhoX family phosphatase
MEVVLVTPEGDVVPFVRVVEPGHEGSEITGPAFSPDGTRLYFSSQRGPTPGTLAEIAGDRGVVGDSRNGGTTWEVTGPFRSGGSGGGSPSTTLAGAAGNPSADPEGDGGGSASAVLPIAGAALAVGAVGAGAWWVRSRRTATSSAGPSAGDDSAS